MKLTNISLAILVALGLAACGGSDDKNDQTTDPKTPPKKEEPKKEEGPKETPKEDPKSGLLPERAAPDLTLPEDMKDLVATRKRVFIDRGFSEKALGYSGANSDEYDSVFGTEPENIKLASTYNFLKERDVLTSRSVAAEIEADSTNTKYNKKSIGAIYVGKDPTTDENNAYVKVDGKYYHVKADPASNPPSVGSTTNYTPLTPFVSAAGSPPTAVAGKKFSQDKVVFIANVKDKADEFELADDPTTNYDVKKDQVGLNNIKVFGKEYSADLVGENLNFGQLKAMKEIQETDITGTYTIFNNKNTGFVLDNKKINRNITLGKIKAYNLPYSIALVTTNISKDAPREKNVFNLIGDKNAPFQVRGFETNSLPREGRAHYYGKSFSASVVGDVHLFADFSENRTSISGSVYNRKNNQDSVLPDLTLHKIPLTDPKTHTTSQFGNVSGQEDYANMWDVTLFGPEAEEAAGMIFSAELNADGTIKSDTKVVKEVYNTQREELTNKSNTADTK